MNGVIYIAVGEQYVEEAKKSAESLGVHTNLHTTIFTDDLERVRGHFSQALPFTGRTDKSAKAHVMKRTPYDRTLFLDTDTYVTADISDLFDILDHYDLAAAHAPRRGAGRSTIPSWFPEMNTGVLLYQRNDVVAEVLDRWVGDIRKVYESEGHIYMDQPTFRRALYSVKDLKLFILPPEYNVRLPIPTFVSRRTKILHGRGELLDIALKRINAHYGMRLWLPRERKLYKWDGDS